MTTCKKKKKRFRCSIKAITNTGAGKAVVKVIPELEGKLTANAVGSTPNGSLAILNLTLQKATNVNVLKHEASCIRSVNW